MATRNDTRIPFRKPSEFELDAALDRLRQATLYARPQLCEEQRDRLAVTFALAVGAFLLGCILGRNLR